MPTISSISGKAFANITHVNSVAVGSIASISSATVPSSGTDWISTIYDFNSEKPQTSAGSDWAPSTSYAADGWLNGNSSGNGSQFRSGTNSKGVNCDRGTTPSGSTGPNGGMTSPTDGTIDSATGQRYLYKEASSRRNGYDHIARTPGYNFSTLMNSTSNNLRLVFGYHAYGSNITPDIYEVWVDTTTTTTTASATLVATLTASGNTMQSGSVAYTIVNIDLNAYRTINSTHYFWLNLPAATGYRADTAIDSVYFEEY